MRSGIIEWGHDLKIQPYQTFQQRGVDKYIDVGDDRESPYLYSSGLRKDIMICVDTSGWMESTESPMFKEQAEAILLYCNEKLKSHSVGVCAMADSALHFLIYPTKDLDIIMDAVNDVMIRRHLRLLDAAANAHSVFLGRLYTPMQTRIVFFSGGPLYCPLDEGRMLATAMKDLNVACDVISFGNPYMDKRKFFDTFANNNGNCNVCHVPPESSVCEALSRSQIIIPRVGGGSSLPPSSSRFVHIYVKAPIDSADDKTDCPFCQRVLLTLKEKKISYETTFINLDNKAEWFDETMTLPSISFDNVTWVSNSDVIVEMIEKKYPEPRLVTPPYLAYLGLKILPKLAEFLKSKDETEENTEENDASKQALLDELKKLDVHLLEYGPYVNGEKITTVDLSLAPKLHHLECACWHYKKWTVLEDLTAVWKYKESLSNLDSFKNTKPCSENVNEGWRRRLTRK